MDVILIACFLLLAGSAASVGIDLTNCDGTARRGDGVVCYKAIRIEDTFESAKKQCSDKGMKVVSIASVEENDAVARLMVSSTLTEIWINMQISLTSWRWQDGSELKEQGCFVGENTMSLYESKTTDNSFETCLKTCESRKYVGLMNSTLCYCGDSLDQTGHLNAFCHTNCPSAQDETCGGVNAQRIVAIDGVYSNWLQDQPNNGGVDGESQMCSILDESMFWNDESCWSNHPALCEINLSKEYFPTCDESITGVHLIKVGENETCVYATNASENYFESVEQCANFNGKLLIIPSAEFTEALKTRVQTGVFYWIGAVRFNQSWASGEQVVYTRWQFFNQSGYGVMGRTSQGWSVADEKAKKFLVCQNTNATYQNTPTYFAQKTTTTTTLPPTKLVVAPITTTAGSFVPPTVNFFTLLVPSPSSSSSFIAQSPGGGGANQAGNPPDQSRAAILGGAIGGGIALAIVVVAVVVVAVVCTRRRPSKKLDDEEAPPSYFFGDDYGTMTSTVTPPSPNNSNKIANNHDYETFDSSTSLPSYNTNSDNLSSASHIPSPSPSHDR